MRSMVRLERCESETARQLSEVWYGLPTPAQRMSECVLCQSVFRSDTSLAALAVVNCIFFCQAAPFLLLLFNRPYLCALLHPCGDTDARTSTAPLSSLNGNHHTLAHLPPASLEDVDETFSDVDTLPKIASWAHSTHRLVYYYSSSSSSSSRNPNPRYVPCSV